MKCSTGIVLIASAFLMIQCAYAEQTICWDADNRYLNPGSQPTNLAQLIKFCKCASGYYGFKDFSADTTQRASLAYQYNDTGNNFNWATSRRDTILRVKSVVCADGKTYSTNQDYYSNATSTTTTASSTTTTTKSTTTTTIYSTTSSSAASTSSAPTSTEPTASSTTTKYSSSTTSTSLPSTTITAPPSSTITLNASTTTTIRRRHRTVETTTTTLLNLSNKTSSTTSSTVNATLPTVLQTTSTASSTTTVRRTTTTSSTSSTTTTLLTGIIDPAAAGQANASGTDKAEERGGDAVVMLLMLLPVLLVLAALAILGAYHLKKKQRKNIPEPESGLDYKAAAGVQVIHRPIPAQEQPKRVQEQQKTQPQMAKATEISLNEPLPGREPALVTAEQVNPSPEPLAPLNEEYTYISAEITRLRGERKNVLSAYHDFRMTTQTAKEKMRKLGDELAPLLVQAHKLAVLIGKEFDEAKESKADILEWLNEKVSAGEYSEILRKDLHDLGLDATIVDEVLNSRKPQSIAKEIINEQAPKADEEKKSEEKNPVPAKPEEKKPPKDEGFDPAM